MRTGAVAVGFAVVGLAAGATLSQASAQARARPEEPYAALDVFARVITQVQESFVDPLTQRELVYRALSGVGAALDRHSAFMDPEAWRRTRRESSGDYVGIGASTVVESCGMRVRSVVRDGPAERGGVAAGDCIVAVDGAPVAGEDEDRVAERIRGREGEAVTLTLTRDGGAPRDVALLRSRVLTPAVEAVAFEPGLAWVRVHTFREGATADLRARTDALGPLRGAVLDLRANPGGRLDEAVALVDRFVRDGAIVSTQGRVPAARETHHGRDDGDEWTWPVVVLVDGQSASAAEIVAGALRERVGAPLVGTRTYGKGSVQSVFEYEDGSALKLTIGRYALPSGATIPDGDGLVPDVVVALPSPAGPTTRLRERLATVAGLSQADRGALLELAEALPADAGEAEPDFASPLGERLAADPQLAAALTELRRRARP